jgi:hypothetical protein
MASVTATVSVSVATGGALAVDLRARRLPSPSTNGANLPLGYIAVGSGTPLRAVQPFPATATAQASSSWVLQTNGTAPTGPQPGLNTVGQELDTDAANGTVTSMDIYLAAMQGELLGDSTFTVSFPFGLTLAGGGSVSPFTVTTSGSDFTVACSTATPTAGLRVSLVFSAPTTSTYVVQILPASGSFMGVQGMAFYGPRQYLVGMSAGPFQVQPFVSGSTGTSTPLVVMPGLYEAAPFTALSADVFSFDSNVPGDTAAPQYFSSTSLLSGLSAPQWLGTYAFNPAWRPSGPAVVIMALVGFQASPPATVALSDTQALSSPLDNLDCAGGAQTSLGAMYVAAAIGQAYVVVHPPSVANSTAFANAGVVNAGAFDVYSSPAFPAATLGVFSIVWGGVAFVAAVVSGSQALVRVDGTYVAGTTATPVTAVLTGWASGSPAPRVVAPDGLTAAFVLPGEAAVDNGQTLTYVSYPAGGGAATVVPGLLAYPAVDDLSTNAVFGLSGGASTVWWKKIGAALQVLVFTQTSPGVFTLDTSNSVTLGPSNSPVTFGPVLVGATATTALFAFVGNNAVKHVRLSVNVGVAATLSAVFSTPGLAGVPGVPAGLRAITFPDNSVAGGNTPALALSVTDGGGSSCWTSPLS